MLLGVPEQVNASLAPVVRCAGKPIRRALPLMVLALLLAPHRRCLKTLSGMVLGRREHVATISDACAMPSGVRSSGTGHWWTNYATKPIAPNDAGPAASGAG
jgi:hypothetical protein